jgi:hypothetical protein
VLIRNNCTYLKVINKYVINNLFCASLGNTKYFSKMRYAVPSYRALCVTAPPRGNGFEALRQPHHQLQTIVKTTTANQTERFVVFRNDVPREELHIHLKAVMCHLKLQIDLWRASADPASFKDPHF